MANLRLARPRSHGLPVSELFAREYRADADEGMLRRTRPKSAAKSWGAGVAMVISRGWIPGTAVLIANFTIGIPRSAKKMNVGENRSETRAN